MSSCTCTRDSCAGGKRDPGGDFRFHRRRHRAGHQRLAVDDRAPDARSGESQPRGARTGDPRRADRTEGVVVASRRSAKMRTLRQTLNGPMHETALRVFMFIVLAHWGEHLLQGLQIYVLGWPVPEARGPLGYFFPTLI